MNERFFNQVPKLCSFTPLEIPLVLSLCFKDQLFIQISHRAFPVSDHFHSCRVAPVIYVTSTALIRVRMTIKSGLRLSTNQ